MTHEARPVMLPGSTVTLEVGCLRVRRAGAELRLEPRSEEEPAAFRTRLFVATHRTHETHIPAAEIERIHRVTLAWEDTLHQVAPGLDEMPAMHALHLLALHLIGTSVILQAEEARALIAGSGRREVGWRDVPRLAYEIEGGLLAGGASAQARAICGRPPASLRAGAHVIVTGPGRSGTRWVLECASRLLSLGSTALTVSSPLVGQDTDLQETGWTDRVSRHNAYFPASDAQAVREALASTSALSSVALACPAAATIVTKVGPWHPAWRWSAAFPKARVVRVQRDPRNVFVSSRRFRKGSGRGPTALAAFLASSSARALVRRALRGWGGRQLVMRYEQMLADLESELQRLASWLHVAISPEVRASMARDLTFEAMAGRRYGEIRDGEYFRGGSDWTHELDAEERRVARLFDPFITRLGYPSTPT